MSLAASRAVLRHSKFAVRRAGVRNASTNEAAGAAKEKASDLQSKAADLQSKASEGLSRVTSSAGNAVSKVSAAASGAAEKVGGRTGRTIGGIQSLIPQVIFYSKVGLELGKLIAQQRSMAPPTLATFQGYFQPIINAARHPASLLKFTADTANSAAQNPLAYLNQVRNLSTTQWLSAGVVAAEVIGFFSVGEMIGRFKLVGYRASAPANH
ncbi:mitochondrial F1F0-ATP synthase-like protein g subunit [Massariosphaeria phaeospora]|uniref:Mitochondrial F1F0-ATP synthase-like protein g subunit n=1 Tax=Massariosphaeria phaeospora TaxID=100035 RepID=A0A7C8MB18_9PLEO|nr:mitochondrial F1F0-ATP synthase-like protein g subunit [Massariosphaeria phaeospora]